MLQFNTRASNASPIGSDNVWHSVSPMTSGDRSGLRRTLTINIERRA